MMNGFYKFFVVIEWFGLPHNFFKIFAQNRRQIPLRFCAFSLVVLGRNERKASPHFCLALGFRRKELHNEIFTLQLPAVVIFSFHRHRRPVRALRHRRAPKGWACGHCWKDCSSS